MALIQELRERMVSVAQKAKDDFTKATERAKAEKRATLKEERESFDAAMADYDKMEAQVKELEDDEKRSKRLESLEEPQRPRSHGAGPATRATEPDDDGEPTLEQRIKAHPTSQKSYRRAFADYIRGQGPMPSARELRSVMGERELRDLQSDSMASGGAAVMPLTLASSILLKLKDLVWMRQLATVMPLDRAESLGVVSLDADPDDADWTPEVATISADSSMAFGRRELTPNKLTKRLKISNKLLAYSYYSMEQLILDRLGYKFAITEEKGFLTGNGNKKPLGVFTASADGIPTSQDTTAASATAIAATDLFSVQAAIKEQYQAGCSWIVSREFLNRTRALVPTAGPHLWQPALSEGNPSTILGKPYRVSEYCPNTFTASLYVAAYGDFSYYWIADSLGMTMQRLNELYAETDQTGFIARKYTDGMPVLAEAFTRLIMHA